MPSFSRNALTPVPRNDVTRYIMARGDRRERIVHDEIDRYSLVKTLGEACGKTGWLIHAWVLMDNHYHAVIETPQGNLVVGMRWFQNTYTRRFNTRHRLWGHLFGGRYKAVLVEGGEFGNGEYLSNLIFATKRCWSKEESLGTANI